MQHNIYKEKKDASANRDATKWSRGTKNYDVDLVFLFSIFPACSFPGLFLPRLGPLCQNDKIYKPLKWYDLLNKYNHDCAIRHLDIKVHFF